MNPGRQPSSPFSSLKTALRWTVRSPAGRLAALAALAVVCTLVFAGAGGATAVDGQYAHGDSPDTTPPTMANGTRINDTAIAVTIADNHDVDESTISAEDFLLSHGSVREVKVEESGSDAVATVRLSRRLNRDEVTVVVQSGATILDTNGNELNSSATDPYVVVSGMDGVPPSVDKFSVTNATGGPATIRLDAREQVSDFYLVVRGPQDEWLDRSDFESTDSGRTWEMSYTPPEDGTYDVYLSNMTDEAGNTRDLGRSRRFIADLTPPSAVAGLDLANSQNLTIAFDASQSSDANGIRQYNWTFGDGGSATGPRVTHDFMPGDYTVELTVTDTYGNTATDTITLNLTRGSGDANNVSEAALRDRAGADPRVSVDRRGGVDSSDAFVGVTSARRDRPVAAGTLAGDAPLAAHGPVSLDGLAVTLATNRSFDLGLSMSGNEYVGDVATATGTIPLAGFTVVNTVPDEEISNATIQFGVTQTHLQTLGVSAASISLYRYHDGGWNAVPTTPRNSTNGTQQFRAETPGFSRFAITTDPQASSNIAVTDATLETAQVAPGETFSVTATVENNGDTAGTFVGGLTTDGAVISTARTTVGAGETTTMTLRSQTSETGTFDLSVNGTSAGTLTVSSAADTGSDFVVTNASLGRQQVDVDEPFSVTATVENRGDEAGTYTAGLVVDGRVVVTETSAIPAGESRPIELQYLVNRSGEFPISVNGTSAGTLTVGDPTGDDSGDDGPLGQLAGLLGVLPLGLLRPVFLFVVLPAAVIYGLLKGLAIYLGY